LLRDDLEAVLLRNADLDHREIHGPADRLPINGVPPPAKVDASERQVAISWSAAEID
jgi:hypothetical protein